MAFDRLKTVLSGMLGGKGKENIYNRNSPYIPFYTSPPKRNTEEWLRTYGHSPRLSVVTKISEDLAFAQGRLIYTNKNGEDEVLPTNHPFWRFWNNPNPLPQFTKEALWQLHQTFLALTGEGYMIVEKDEFGHPAELWPIPPHWVTSTPSSGNPHYNIRTPAGYIAEVHVDDVFVQMELNPVDPYGRGLGRAQAIADEVEIDEYASDFEKRFFYNDATPSSVIALEGADPSAVERFEKSWNNKHRGVDNSHKTAVASGRVTAIKLADNMKDLDMVQGRLYLRDTVLEHFHMPREIMGITENSNRSTAEAAQYIYAQNVLTPYLKKRERAINIQIIPYWGENIRYEFDEIIPRNQEFDKAVAMEGWGAGLLSRDEARAKIDMEPLANDVIQAPLLFGYAKPEDDLTKFGGDYDSDIYSQFSDEAEKSIRRQNKSKISRVDMRMIRLMERAQKEREKQTGRAFSAHFGKQRGKLVNNLLSTVKSVKDDSTGLSSTEFSSLEKLLSDITAPLKRAEVVTSFVSKLVDWNQDETLIREILSNTWKKTYEQGDGIMERLYDLKNPHRDDVGSIFKRMGGSKISKKLSETTRNAICNVIDNGLADGLGIDDIAAKIEECSELSPGRSRLIATQETYNSLSASNYDSMKNSGVERHKWITRGDDKVRDSHAEMNGEVVNIDEPFSNGLMYPRDTNGKPEQVLGCRCWAVPVRNRAGKKKKRRFYS